MTYCEKYENRAEPSSSSLKIIASVTLPLGVLFAFTCLFYFLFNHKKYFELERRNLGLTLILFSLSLLLFLLGTIRAIVGADIFSCKLLGVVYLISRYLFLFCGVARLFSLLWRVEYNHKLIGDSYQAVVKGKLHIPVGSFEFIKRDVGAANNSFYKPSFFPDGNQELVKKRGCLRQQCYSAAQSLSPCLFKVCCWKPSEELPNNLQFAQLLASKYFSFVACLVCSLVPAIIIFFGTSAQIPFDEDCFGCLILSKYRLMPPVVHGLGVFIAFWYFYGLFRLRNIPDSLGIKTELLVVGGAYTVYFIILAILSFTTQSVQENGKFHVAYLESLFHLTIIFLIFPLQVVLVKRNNSSNTSSGSQLAEILQTTEGKQAFSLYLVSSLSLETLLFYEQATKWISNYDSLSSEEKETEAMHLYNKYIGEDCVLEINISSYMRNKIRIALDNTPAITVFDEAINEMIKLMANDLYPGFERSDYYRAYLNEEM